MGQIQPQTPDFESLETFLTVNSHDIPAADRAILRAVAIKAINGEALDLRACPDHLADAFRRLVREAAYQFKCRQLQGKARYYDPKESAMLTGGMECRSSAIRPPATKPKRQRSALRPDFRKTYGMRKNKTTGAIPGSGRKPKADPVCKTKAFYLTQSQVETGITGKEVREAISDFIQKKSEKKFG